MLEDDFEDILKKAIRGQRIELDALSRDTGIGQKIIEELLAGRLHDEALFSLAETLGLDGQALLAIARGDYLPEVNLPGGIERFESPFHAWSVFSYLLWDEKTRNCAIFDTGTDPRGLLDFISTRKLAPQFLFLTHADSDHVDGLPEILKKHPDLRVLINALEGRPVAEYFSTGDVFQLDDFQITTRLTRGHTAGGTTFVIDGLPQKTAIVGDALFAGSMGMVRTKYKHAIESNQKEIFSLPDETILCPGHGPLTTVRDEKRSNPFFVKSV